MPFPTLMPRRAIYPANLLTNPLIGQWAAYSQVFKDAGVTPAANTDTVQQWNLIGGFGGSNMVQATSGNRPQFLTGQQNSLPGIKFNGTKALTSSFTTMSDGTVFLVLQRNTRVAATMCGSGSSADGLTGKVFLIDTTTGDNMTVSNNGGTTTVTGPSTGTWGIVCLAAGASTGRFRYNANTSTNITGSGTNGWVGYSLGRTANSQGWTVGEVLVYSGILSVANETIVRNYLNSVWKIF